MQIVLLPGLDGTGKLFDEFANKLAENYKVTIVSYPAMLKGSYRDYVAYINPNYAIEITNLAIVIVPWAFTKNHRLTFGLSSNFLQTPTTQALSLILAILLHNSGLKSICQKMTL